MSGKSLQDKITQGRQYRTMKLECRASGNDEEFIVEGYATTFNEPYLMGENDFVRVYEQVDPSAFDNCEMDDVIMQYDHEGRVFARIKNGTLKLEKDDHGLKVIADLGGTTEGRKLYEEIKGGYTDKMSFGFMVREDREDSAEIDGKRTFTRTITDISRLYDVSAVSLPANDGTEISARSYYDGLFKQYEQRTVEEQSNEAERQAEEQRKAEEKAKQEQAERERFLFVHSH